MNPRTKTAILLYGGMLLVATCLNTMAPLMVEFQRVFSVDMSLSALIPMSQSSGTILANLFATFWLARLGTRRGFFLAIILNVSGLVLLRLSGNLPLLCAGIFLVGASFALALTTFSTIMGHLPRQEQRFARLHAFFGIGGLTAPLLVNAVLIKGQPFQVVFGWELAGALLLAALVFACRPVPDYRSDHGPLSGSKKPLPGGIRGILVLLGIYSVSEMSLVIWCGNRFQQELGWHVDNIALLISGFWVLFTLGRFFGDHLIHRFPPVQLVRLSCVASFLALSLFIWGPAMTVPVLFLVTAGTISIIFPAIHFLVNQHIPPGERARINAILFLTVSTAGLGGIPLIGIAADAAMKPGLSLLLIPYLLILILLPRLIRYMKRPHMDGPESL